MINFSDVRRLNEAQSRNIKTGYDRFRLTASLSPQLVKYVCQMVKAFPFPLPFSSSHRQLPLSCPSPQPGFCSYNKETTQENKLFPRHAHLLARFLLINKA